MTEEEIDDVVCEIMYNAGPDRHVDGHEIITDFIIALLLETDKKWVEKYKKKINSRV